MSLSRKHIPVPSFLDTCRRLRAYSGQKRWASFDGKRLYTWDYLHGEIEVFDKRGNHLGALDPESGEYIKGPVRGRKIDV